LQPPHRGLFRSAGGEIAAWVNGEDHLQLIGVQLGPSARAAFEVVHAALGAIERSLLENGKSFAAHRRLGYLTSCPSNLGTSRSHFT
jgi:creatine kinase